MGHIVTGLIIHFAPRGLTRLAPMERELFNEEFLTRAKIISEFQMKLEDADNRRCYQCRHTALKYGDVPLPKFVENFDDVSEEEEEDVKPQMDQERAEMNANFKESKRDRVSKRKRIEDSIERVEKKIEEVANRSNKMIGDMIMNVITKFKVYETLRDVRMDNLIAEVQELKQMIS